MSEDFVPYELLCKLREKGYKCKYTRFEGHIYDIFKWLRDKNMHVEPCILADADTDADGKVINEYTYWSFSVTNVETGDMVYFEYEHIDDKRFESYEQAALAGIEYVIDKLI